VSVSFEKASPYGEVEWKLYSARITGLRNGCGSIDFKCLSFPLVSNWDIETGPGMCLLRFVFI